MELLFQVVLQVTAQFWPELQKNSFKMPNKYCTVRAESRNVDIYGSITLQGLQLPQEDGLSRPWASCQGQDHARMKPGSNILEQPGPFQFSAAGIVCSAPMFSFYFHSCGQNRSL
jgi:hypothetical protein